MTCPMSHRDNFLLIRPFFRREENTEKPCVFLFVLQNTRYDITRSKFFSRASLDESQFRDSTFLDSQEESTRILFLGEPNQCSIRRCCWSEIDNKGKLMNHDFLLPVCTYKPVTCICSGI